MEKKKLSQTTITDAATMSTRLLSVEDGSALRLNIQTIAEIFRIGATPLYTDTRSIERDGAFISYDIGATIPSGTNILLSLDIDPITIISRYTIALYSATGRENVVYFNPEGAKRYFFEFKLTYDLTRITVYPQQDNQPSGSEKAGIAIFSNLSII